ncbi:alpha/beta hydrolase [Stakelama tenebrarum]|uniref:Alpha/beta fold hydrolase n=1 Tax=Stakelama tenebrarum TaxID=2711215 RepID=A0A6G6Y4G1_9SPHN|nr:alpha/beta fold hydrolase [Sphingosinithalassobacter tenebrarum]QIG79790.1 alpha/beta fold hydrolase [Sphingosinithalassobacter tenebrarum]
MSKGFPWLKAGVAAVAMLAVAPALAQQAPGESEITAPGPKGALAGSLIDAGQGAPVVLIIPGSGPTDRNGDNPMGASGGVLRQLAQGLAAEGVSSVRIDKRGLFGSAEAVENANRDSSIAGYAADADSWIVTIREKTGAPCVWILGHSEGGLVALKATENPGAICGVILVETAGRKMGDVVRQQFRDNPANAPVLDDALSAVDSLEAGETVDTSTFHPALRTLFNADIQPYWIDVFSHDPVALAKSYSGPMMIVQGTSDIQVTEADFELLREARPDAETLLVPDMTHVLRIAEEPGMAANLATYTDPDMPIVPGLAPAIAGFVKANSGQ